jgi:hypothetical protein
MVDSHVIVCRYRDKLGAAQSWCKWALPTYPSEI